MRKPAWLGLALWRRRGWVTGRNSKLVYTTLAATYLVAPVRIGISTGACPGGRAGGNGYRYAECK